MPSSHQNANDDLNASSNIKRVDDLEDKVSRCFSADRYEAFQDAVEKIALKTIDGTGRDKIKAHAKESAKDYNQEQGWTKKTFWLPVVISIIATLAAVVAVIVAIFKH